MTVSDLQTSLLQKLNDDGTYYTSASMLAALNEAQRMFVLMTLCLETSATLPLEPGQATYNLLATIPDFLIVRRVLRGDGMELDPYTLAELDALNPQWMVTDGEPTGYSDLGLDFLAITPQPTAAENATVVYANAPAPLVNPTDVPQIRKASHYALANYAACALRQPEGSQELSKFAGYFGEFLEEAQKVADLVRARCVDAGYERMPAQLRLGDKSRGRK